MSKTYSILWARLRSPFRSNRYFKRLGPKRRDLGGVIFIDLRDREGDRASCL